MPSLSVGLPLLRTTPKSVIGSIIAAPLPPAFDDPDYAAVIDVDTGGAGDYLSLATAEAANRTLNNPKPVAFICRASTGARDIEIANFTAAPWGSTIVEIWQADIDYHNGIFSTTKYAVRAIISSLPNFLMDGIQIDPTTSSPTNCLLYNAINPNAIIRNVISRTYHSTGTEGIKIQCTGTGIVDMYNTISFALDVIVGSTDAFIQSSTGTVIVNLHNCIAYNCASGFILIAGATTNLKNCVAAENTTFGDYVGTATTASYCVSKDATAPGTNSIINQNINFKNAAAGDLRLVFDSPGYKDGTASGKSWDYGFDISRIVWPAIPSMGSHQGTSVDRARLFTFSNAEFLSVVNNAELSGANGQSFTFAAMVNLLSIGANRAIAWKGLTSANFEWYLYYQHSGLRFRLAAWNGVGAEITAVNANELGAPSINVWYYVVGWYDSVLNTLNIQANNNAGTALAWPFATKPTVNTTNAFEIGRAVTSTTYANGRICRAGFWKRVLTTEERTWLYNSGISRIRDELEGQTLLTDLKGYWDNDEFSGVANDSFGLNNLTDNNTVTSGDGPA